ncbi:hypothetical protein [Halonatronum saccharophilum]|uniref:hypothetical protein n=1 Tax=Halonatronum saccharophilum TaxID=150060 RepID=UPI0004878B6D|nr:hypothetical protein [Halonatronum saccharophilum]
MNYNKKTVLLIWMIIFLIFLPIMIGVGLKIEKSIISMIISHGAITFFLAISIDNILARNYYVQLDGGKKINVGMDGVNKTVIAIIFMLIPIYLFILTDDIINEGVFNFILYIFFIGLINNLVNDKIIIGDRYLIYSGDFGLIYRFELRQVLAYRIKEKRGVLRKRRLELLSKEGRWVEVKKSLDSIEGVGLLEGMLSEKNIKKEEIL